MIRWLAFAVICVILWSGCTAGPNPNEGTQRESAEKPAGFWRGVWHGMIILLAFLVSLFKSSVGVYEVHNTGWSYNLGFSLGVWTTLVTATMIAGTKKLLLWTIESSENN